MYGDKRILEQHLPAMSRWIDWCQLHSTNLIRDHDLAVITATGCRKARTRRRISLARPTSPTRHPLVARAYAAIGDAASAEKYRQLDEQIKAAIQSALCHGRWSTSRAARRRATAWRCVSICCRKHCGGQRPQYLADDVAAHQNHLTTGFIGVSYLLPSLCSQGQVKTAYDVFLQDTFPSWLFSVKQGATTIWERWDGWTPQKGFQSPSMNSFNHYSLGSCGEWMFDHGGGHWRRSERAGLWACHHSSPAGRRSDACERDVRLDPRTNFNGLESGGRKIFASSNRADQTRRRRWCCRRRTRHPLRKAGNRCRSIRRSRPMPAARNARWARANTNLAAGFREKHHARAAKACRLLLTKVRSRADRTAAGERCSARSNATNATPPIQEKHEQDASVDERLRITDPSRVDERIGIETRRASLAPARKRNKRADTEPTSRHVST